MKDFLTSKRFNFIDLTGSGTAMGFIHANLWLYAFITIIVFALISALLSLSNEDTN